MGSWYLGTQLNKLTEAYDNLANTALTNPMVNNLNMNTYSVNNASQLLAPPSTNLTIGVSGEIGRAHV